MLVLDEEVRREGENPVDEMPEIEAEAPEEFSDETVKKLLAEIDEEERTAFRFFLGSGCREQEVSSLRGQTLTCIKVPTPSAKSLKLASSKDS